MPLTLEMPSAPESLPGQTTFIPDAEAGLDAADLIDQGEQEAEAEETDERSGPLVPSPAEAADPDYPPLDTNEATGEAPADAVPVPCESQPRPAAVEQPPADPIPTSHATRKFQIATVTAEYTEVCLELSATKGEIERHKERLKSLEKEFDRLSLELMHLRNDAEFQPRLPMGDAGATDGERLAGQDAANPPAAIPDASQPAAASVTIENDAWKSAPLADLGLPPKLAEKLAEVVDTMGQLENMRAEISLGKRTWPKGIGAAKITIIEDAVVKWLTANRDAAVFQQAGTQSAETQDVRDITAESKDAPPAVSSDQPTATEPTAKPKRTRKKKEPASAAAAAAAQKPPGNASPHRDNGHVTPPTTDPTDAEWSAAIAARATAINDGSTGCLDARLPKPAKQWDSGYEAYSRGLDLTDCPYVVGAEQDDWLRGWMGARAVRDLPDAGEPAAVAATAATAPAAATAAPATLYGDDIDDI